MYCISMSTGKNYFCMDEGRVRGYVELVCVVSVFWQPYLVQNMFIYY